MSRCSDCHAEYQNGIYKDQMLEACYDCAAHLDKFTNWGDNPAVKDAIVQLMGKCVNQLGLQVRGIPAEGQQEAGAGEEPGAEDGNASIATTESGWEVLEKGGSVMLEFPAASAEGEAEKKTTED